MSNFHLYKRSNVVPPAITGDAAKDADSLRRFLIDLAQEVRQIHNSILSFKVAVAGGAGSTAVTLPAPMPDADYRISVVGDWNTTHKITALTKTGFTDTYGTAAPGGGGTLYVIAIA